MSKHHIIEGQRIDEDFPTVRVFPESLEYNKQTGEYEFMEGCIAIYRSWDDMEFIPCSGNTLPSHHYEDKQTLAQYYEGMPVA